MNHIIRTIWNEVTRTFVVVDSQPKNTNRKGDANRVNPSHQNEAFPLMTKIMNAELPTNASTMGRGARNIVYTSVSPMALEPRFVFDGAGATEIVDGFDGASIDDQSQEDQVNVQAEVDLEAIVQELDAEASNLFKTSSEQSNDLPVLKTATVDAEQRIDEFLQQDDVLEKLFTMFSGNNSEPTDAWLESAQEFVDDFLAGDVSISVEILPGDVLQGAKAAFAAEGPDSEPVIYLNQQWLQEGVDQETVTRVLIEEIGHLADHLINQGDDTYGDEGQAFAQMVTTGDIPQAPIAQQSDAGTIVVDGQQINVEFAAFSFINAYEMVYDLDNDGQIDNTERWAEKEQNTHYFDTQELGQTVVDDDSNSPFFSGNDVSAIGIKIGDETLYGWISRPIKANGIVRGFYFWTDNDFTDLQTAQDDGNTDGDRDVSDNRGFLLVVDQAWFDGEIASTSRPITFTADNTKDGNLGTIDVAAVGSSSDKVDSALNALIVPNSPPTPVGDSLTVSEDSGTTIITAANGLLSNDTDPDNDLLTVTGFSVAGVTTNADSTYTIPDVGDITINADGSYSFTPVANYSGTVPPITYTVSDGNGGTATATLSILVTEVNDPPVSTNDEITIGKNSTVVLGLQDFGTFNDVDGDALVNVQITAIPAGSLEYNNDSEWVQVSANDIISANDINGGKLRYTPVTDASGSPYSTLEFKVSDGELFSVSDYILTINVNATNTIPVAKDDTAPDAIEAGGVDNGTVGTNPTGNVLSNDVDADGDKLTVTLIDAETVDNNTSSSNGTSVSGNYGTLVIGADGSYLYTVDNTNANVQALRTTSDTLTEIFSYTVSDGSDATDTALLTVVIRGSNDAPVAVDDYSALQKQEGSGTPLTYGSVTANALDNDTDVDGGDDKTIVNFGISGSATGTTESSSELVFSEAPGTNVKAEYFVFLDAGGDAGEPLLDANGTQIQIADNYNEGTTPVPLSAAVANVDLNDYSSLYFALKDDGSGSGGTATYQSVNNVADRTITISGLEGTIVAGMSVTGADIPEGTTVSSVTASEGMITSVELNTEVSVQGEALTFINSVEANEIAAGVFGSLQLDANGDYTYVLTSNALEPGQSYIEKFSYTMEDTAGLTSSAVINIALSSPNILTVNNDSATTEEDKEVGGNVLTNDTPTSGETTVTNFNWAGDTANAGEEITLNGVGALTINADGSFTFIPAPNYNGTVPTALYTATNDSETASATLSLSITPVNDPPVANNDTSTAYEAGGISNATIGVDPSGNVLSNDEDADGDTLTVTLIESENVSVNTTSENGTSVAGTYGTLVIGADGSYRYTLDNSNTNIQALNSGETLQDAFSYTISDGSKTDTDTDTATLTITINGANDAPVNTVPGPQSLNSYETLALTTLAANDEDDDISNVKLSVGNGTLSGTLDGDGTLEGTGTAADPLTISGTIAEINAMLASVIYAPNTSFSGSDSLRMLTTDKTGLTDLNFVAIEVLEDDRPLEVTGTEVNEASPYVLFSVQGEAGQSVTLELGTTGTGDGHAVTGADFLPNLQYFDGSDWLNYTGAPVQIPSGGTLLVRTAVLQDNINEGSETLKLTATNQAGTSATDNSSIIDDGTGEIYLASNTTGNADTSGDGYPAYLDDDRPISVNDIAVNEASPYAVFTVTGNVDQVIRLNLIEGTAKVGSNATDGSEDYKAPLQISTNNGATWANYTANTDFTLTTETLLVRVPLIDDTLYEGQEGFALEATRVSQNDKTYGVASIYDDGTGVIFADDGTENTAVTKDDDRIISINNPTVNEASDIAVFTITGNPGQTVLLDYVAGTANNLGAPTIKVWDGLDWVTYDPDNALPTFDDDGKIYVSVDITGEQEAAADNDETFKLKATLAQQSISVSNTGAITVTNTPVDEKAATGTATIKDDGSGAYWFGDRPESATPEQLAAAKIVLDDDGSVTITNVTVNEGSNWAVFEVTGVAGQSLTLGVSQGSGAGFASLGTTPAIQVWNGSAWVAYSSNAEIPTTGPLYVRVDITAEQDAPFEGSETFQLTATADGRSFNGTGTIVDDGTGVIFGDNAAPTDRPSTTGLDDDRAEPPAPAPIPDVPDPVELPTVEFQVTEVNRPPAAPFNSTIVMTTSPVGPSTADQPVTSALMDRSFREASGVPFSFAEVLTRGEGYKVVVLEGVDPILSVYNGITDQFAEEGTESSFALPYDAFAHTDPNEEISLSASLADGEDLPDWLRFDAESGTFIVQAPDGFNGELRIKVIARDSKGQQVETLFRFIVGADDNAEAGGADGDGRSSLSDQIREAGLAPALIFAADMVQDFADEWLMPLADAQKT